MHVVQGGCVAVYSSDSEAVPASSQSMPGCMSDARVVQVTTAQLWSQDNALEL